MPESFVSRLGKAASAFGRVFRSQPLPNQLNYQYTGVPAPFKPQESLEAFDYNVWLGASVKKIAGELARITPRLRTKTKDGYRYFENDESDLLEVLNCPQPIAAGRSKLTGFQLRYITGMHLCLLGEAFWLLDGRRRINGVPTRLDLLVPGNVYIKNDPNTGDLLHYIYKIPGKETILDPLDVVHFKLPDPKDWTRGHAPTQQIRYALDTYREAEKMNLKRLENNGVPPGFIKVEDKNPDEARLKRLKTTWDSLYKGTENAGRVGVLTGGMDFKETQQTNSDMQFLEGKDSNKDEILANYGVSLEVLGQTDSVTRANAEAAIYVFMRFGVLPFVESVFDTLNNDFKPAFTGNQRNEFSFDDPVPDNVEEKRQTASLLFNSGAISPDEMRKMFGMEPLGIVGVTDVPYQPLMSIPAGQPPPELAPLT